MDNDGKPRGRLAAGLQTAAFIGKNLITPLLETLRDAGKLAAAEFELWKRDPAVIPSRLQKGARSTFDLWINEKSRWPQMAAMLLIMAAGGPILHLSGLTILTAAWGVNKIPEVRSLYAANKLRKAGDPNWLDRWIRPQWYWYEVPDGERQKVTDAFDGAASPDKKHTGWAKLCERNVAARWVDAWANERNRAPGELFELIILGVGIFGLKLSWKTYLIDAVFGDLPMARSFYKALRHGDLKRAFQPQSFGFKRVPIDTSDLGTKLRRHEIPTRQMVVRIPEVPFGVPETQKPKVAVKTPVQPRPLPERDLDL